MNELDRRILRRELRASRRALTPLQQRQASQRLFRRLAQHPLFRRSQHIAFYLANDGEIDPSPLFRLAQRLGKQCYLPVIAGWPTQRMRFQRLRSDQRWKRNRFGIQEPISNPHLQTDPWRLSLVLMPLVGFDQRGNRLGMGGGFYDRAFSYRRRHKNLSRPTLLGLAHACQEVAHLPTAAWDIPLDGIVSDQQIILLQKS